jgi:MoaA/NifB/PqqE/SkfB family radical SAM enzyme
MEKEESNYLISGISAAKIKVRAGITLLQVSFSEFRNPYRAMRALRMLFRQRRRIHGNTRDHKIVSHQRRFYWSIYTPGFPSAGFNNVIRREIRKAYPSSGQNSTLQTLIISISSRCQYSCEHCFEGDNLTKKEFLSLQELIDIQDDALRSGIRHIQLGGGEPMLRFEEMVRLIESARGQIDFWISTSGYNLTADRAKSLKQAGAVGATISLDHWEEAKHNSFRNYPNAYTWVLEAVESCHKAGIIPNLTLCLTRETANWDDLMSYMELSRRLDVPFVRFLEARKAGNYAGKDVLLNKADQDLVQSFFLKLNSEKAYKSYPIIQYPGYHQRKVGCYGAGNRYMFIDAKGNYLGCPFCRNKVGNIRNTSLSEAIDLIQQKGCSLFQTNQLV